MGFERALDDSVMPAWWQEHSSDWYRPQDGAAIDLHRRLVGVRLDPGAAWDIFAEDLVTMPIGGAELPVLGARARLVHVTLHAAQHGAGGGGKGRLHLEHALGVFGADAWRDAADLAARLDATDAFSADCG